MGAVSCRWATGLLLPLLFGCDAGDETSGTTRPAPDDPPSVKDTEDARAETAADSQSDEGDDVAPDDRSDSANPKGVDDDAGGGSELPTGNDAAADGVALDDTPADDTPTDDAPPPPEDPPPTDPPAAGTLRCEDGPNNHQACAEAGATCVVDGGCCVCEIGPCGDLSWTCGYPPVEPPELCPTATPEQLDECASADLKCEYCTEAVPSRWLCFERESDGATFWLEDGLRICQ